MAIDRLFCTEHVGRFRNPLLWNVSPSAWYLDLKKKRNKIYRSRFAARLGFGYSLYTWAFTVVASMLWPVTTHDTHDPAEANLGQHTDNELYSLLSLLREIHDSRNIRIRTEAAGDNRERAVFSMTRACSEVTIFKWTRIFFYRCHRTTNVIMEEDQCDAWTQIILPVIERIRSRTLMFSNKSRNFGDFKF